MNRRLFLRSLGIATGAFFIPDQFFLKAERFMEREYRPYLVNYANPVYTILANESGDLHIGNPFQGPERFPTWREYFLKCTGYTTKDLTRRFLDEEWNLEIEDLDREVENEYYWGWWLQHESSGARAYNFLQPLGIGPEIHKDGEIVGHLSFMDCPTIGSDTLITQIDDHYSLPFLQWRLEQLGQPCNFEVEQ